MHFYEEGGYEIHEVHFFKKISSLLINHSEGVFFSFKEKAFHFSRKIQISSYCKKLFYISGANLLRQENVFLHLALQGQCF